MLLFNQSWPQPAYDISSNPVINGIFRSGQRGQRRLRPPRLQSGADRVATRLPLIHHPPISRVGTTSPPYIFSKRTQYDVVLSLPCMLIFKCWPIFWTNTGIEVFIRAGHVKTLPQQHDRVFRLQLFDLAVLLYSLWQLHLDTETLFFADFFLFLRFYYVVAELKNCRVSSSGIFDDRNKLVTSPESWGCGSDQDFYDFAQIFSTLHILFISKWSAWNKSTGSGTNLHVYNLIKSYLLIFVLGNILGCKSFKMKSLIRIPDRGMPSS